MTKKPEQFAGGTLSGDGSGVEVCPDRLDAVQSAQKIASGRLRTHDPDALDAPALGKPAFLGPLFTTKCGVFSLLTPREASEFLGVPETTLAQWRSQHRGPVYVKLESRLVRYRRSDLEAYIGQHLVETEVDKAHA